MTESALGGTWMFRARGICPRQRKGQAIRVKLEPLLREELDLRIGGQPVPSKLKKQIKDLEAGLVEVQAMPSVAPCLFCDAEVDLNGVTGHLLSIRQHLNIGTGQLRYWGKGMADGLDVAICDDCIHKINDYDDLITEEVED